MQPAADSAPRRSRLTQRLASLRSNPMVRNGLALYGVTIANAILPLVTVPYLARVLHPAAWGSVLFAQSVAIWLAMVVEYGFVYSATREIARHASEPDQVRQIVARVMGSKLLLCLLSAAIAAVMGFTIPIFREHVFFLIATLWIAIAQGMSPLWFFQGIERMTLPALLDVGFRTLYTISVFFVIKQPADAPLVLFYQAVSITIPIGIALVIMYRRVGFTICSVRQAWGELRSAWHFFLFVAVINVYAKANSFMLGVLVNPAVVGFYGGPERLMRGLLSFTGPINQLLYPRLSQLVRHDFHAARSTVRNATVFVGSCGILMALMLSLGAPWFVLLLFGAGYEAATPVLRVLAWVCPLSATTSILGIRWMFPLGLEHQFNRIALAGALLDLILVVPLASWQQALGVAWTLLLTETLILTAVFVSLWVARLNPFQKQCIPPVSQTATTPAAE